MAGDPRPVIVQTNCGSEAEARTIGRAAVEAELAACANIHGPIISIYRWQGAIAEEPEWVVYLKTTEAAIDALEALVKEHHSYDLPAFLVLPISGGERRYLEWLATGGRD
jgi:periplasmic divalent cation tolerance protein